MKTLDEHNQIQIQLHKIINKQGAGVKCPKCGKEIIQELSKIILASDPPKAQVRCDCGYIGYKILN